MNRTEDPANKPLTIENLHSASIFPPLSDRKAWEGIQSDPKIREFRDKLVADAEKMLETRIVELPASGFIDFIRTGNRSRYETLYFERRTRLHTLFLAEAFEYKGRFTERLIDEIWAILNEATWCLPAHITIGKYLDEKEDPKADDPLRYYGYEVVDIFSAETSSYLSTVYRLAYDELKAVSLGFVNRMRDVILNRAIRTFDFHADYYWRHIQENWNAWICANLLLTANNMLQDEPEKLTDFVKTILQPGIDFYMHEFTEDGCCDEGPRYWALSPNCIMLYYEILYLQSDGRISIYDSPKFRKMGEYIADMGIGDDLCVNFADCPVQNSFRQSIGVISRFAERTGSRKLRDYCLNFRAKHPHILSLDTARTLANLFMEKPGEAVERGDFDVWYDIRQVLVVKSGRLHLAAKAGTNHENHNHNDVGQFILSADDVPFVVDLGAPEYTRDTFNEQLRYNNPILNSLYHNVPVFDGQGQAAGDEFEARDVQFVKTGNLYRLSMELAGTYPKELGVLSCKRVLELDLKTNTLTVSDTWRTQEPRVFSLTLFTTADPADAPYAVETTLPLKTETIDLRDALQLPYWKIFWKSNLASPRAVSGTNTMKFTLKELKK